MPRGARGRAWVDVVIRGADGTPELLNHVRQVIDSGRYEGLGVDTFAGDEVDRSAEEVRELVLKIKEPEPQAGIRRVDYPTWLLH